MEEPFVDYIMVLNDGETFTSLDGCRIVAVPDEFDVADIEEGLSLDTLPVIRQFGPVPHEADFS